jgi:transposase-like protein
MNLIDVTRELGTDDECYSFLEKMRWPDGVCCPICGCDKISKITRKAASKNKRAQIYQCLEKTCKQQFSVTSGTIFHDSRIPLTKWFLAISLVMDAKKGMSAKQLQQYLGLGSYQTAWHMTHRIRKAMSVDSSEVSKLGGTVEMDETYVGGKTIRRGKASGRSTRDKDIVVGLRERGGKLRLMHVDDVRSETLKQIAEAHVSDDVEMIVTDDFKSYPLALKKFSGKHHRINHSLGYYVTGEANEIHTNTIESAFSLFKRGLLGSYHQVSIKHLHRYLSEFEYRFNERKALDKFSAMVKRTAQISPLPYRQLVGNPVESWELLCQKFFESLSSPDRGSSEAV